MEDKSESGKRLGEEPGSSSKKLKSDEIQEDEDEVSEWENENILDISAELPPCSRQVQVPTVPKVKIPADYNPLLETDAHKYNLVEHFNIGQFRSAALEVSHEIAQNENFANLDYTVRIQFAKSEFEKKRPSARPGPFTSSSYGQIRDSFLVNGFLYPSYLKMSMGTGNQFYYQPTFMPYKSPHIDDIENYPNEVGKIKEEFFRQATEIEYERTYGVKIKIITLYGFLVHENRKIFCKIDGLGVVEATGEILFIWEGKWIEPFNKSTSIINALNNLPAAARARQPFNIIEDELPCINPTSKIGHQVRSMISITKVRRCITTVGLSGFVDEDPSTWKNIELVDYIEPEGVDRMHEEEQNMEKIIEEGILEPLAKGFINGLGLPTANYPPVYCVHCDIRVPFDQMNDYHKGHTICTWDLGNGEICGEKFEGIIQVKEHRHNVHGEEGTYKCTIENCPSKPYVTLRRLAVHMKLHETIRSIPCQYCGKTFSKPRNLKVHFSLHDPTLPQRVLNQWTCPNPAHANLKLTINARVSHLQINKNEVCRNMWNADPTNANNQIRPLSDSKWFCVSNCGVYGSKMASTSQYDKHRNNCPYNKEWVTTNGKPWNGSLWKCVDTCNRVCLRGESTAHKADCQHFKTWTEQNPTVLYNGNIPSISTKDN